MNDIRFEFPIDQVAVRSCAISGCERSKYARGYCRSHYDRFMKHGDPLCGRTFRGAAEKFITHEIVGHSGQECVTWPFGRDARGYGFFCGGRKPGYASRYICALVHGEPPTPTHEAAHSCGNGHLGCVNPNHLEWKTPVQNQADRLLHGTRSSRERHGRAKLNEEAVIEIRNSNLSQSKLANKFGVSQGLVSKIKRNLLWQEALL